MTLPALAALEAEDRLRSDCFIPEHGPLAGRRLYVECGWTAGSPGSLYSPPDDPEFRIGDVYENGRRLPWRDWGYLENDIQEELS